MAKKRKTRQQKISSDLRHQHVSPSVSSSSQISLQDLNRSTTFINSSPQSTPNVLHLNEYNYVRHDLIKTLLITGAIVAAQLVLYFLAGR